MKHSKVVVDTYDAVGNNHISVQGRYNHASSTEVDIERTFQIQLEKVGDDDQKFEDGFELISSPLYNHNQHSTDVNFGGDDPTIETHTNAVNRTIDSMLYKPDGCNNAYECFPKEQSILVPYLVDNTVRNNNNFYNPTSKTLKILKNEHTRIWYDPSFFGDIFISTFGATGQAANVPEGNHIAGNAHVFTTDGLQPRNLVRFDGEVDGLIPVNWGVEDTLLCAPGRVEIHDSVFGLAVDEYKTFTLQHELFQIPFSTLGLARQSGGDVYARAVATHEEMMPVDITAGIVPRIAVTAQTGENAKIVMWLRRPSYARGNIINRDVHPGIRLLGANTYFGHQDTVAPVGGGVPVPDANPSAIPTPFLTYPRYLSKRKGTNVPAPAAKTVPLGTWSVEFATRKSIGGLFLEDLRTISELRLTISDNALYQYLRDDGNATTTRALVLEASRFVKLPLPGITEQHAGIVPTEKAVPLVLFYQRRHAHDYDDATRQIRFQRAALAAQGQGWGYGRPLLCPLSELTGLRDDTGALLQTGAGANISVGLLNPLAVKSGMVNTLEGTYTFATQTSGENNNTLTHGTKVLFENHQNNEMWNHRIRFRPWVKVQRQVTTIPNGTPTVEYIVYPNNGAAQADAANQASTIEYHLYDSDVLFKEHREAYTGLDDATKATHWDGYISQARVQWLKIQRQTTTDPNTNQQTTAYYLWTNADQPRHADNANQVSVTQWIRLRLQGDPYYATTFLTIGEAMRRTWYAEYYQANPNEVDELLAAEQVAQDRDDFIFHDLSSTMQGTVSTLVPHFYEEVGVPVAQPSALRDVGTVTLREKLFGYKTLNCLQPSKIFPQFGEFYPISLQDYELTFRVNSDPRNLFRHSQTKVAQIDPVLKIKSITSSEPTRIYVRSRDSENQQEKELLKCSYFYPEFERFQTVKSHQGETVDGAYAKVVVRCVTGSIMPDYVFVYVERLAEEVGLYEHECPKIEALRVSRNEQAARIYNSGLMTKYDLYDCTRRNSHPRADLQQLYKEFGGVLLSKFDLGTLLSEELATYRLELEFEITLAREPSNEDTSSTVPQSLVAILDDNFVNTDVSDAFPDNGPAARVRYDARIQLPTRTTVLFIYENGSHLVGEPRKLIFKKESV